MQNTSEAYKAAIVGSRRRISPLAVVEIISPDIVYESASSSGMESFCNPAQLYDKVIEPGPQYNTLEHNYCLLDGTRDIIPAGIIQTQEGIVLTDICDNEGIFASPKPYVELNVSGLTVLQVASVWFNGRLGDGVAQDFTFSIYSGVTEVYSENVVGNFDRNVSFDGFTAYNVTAIRVTFLKWSLPRRRPRTVEIIPGIFEQWDDRIIYSVDVVQETSFDCMSVPHGVANLVIYNRDKRFNPHSKSSIFKSIEARQGIPISYGVKLPNGSVENIPLGVFYQQDKGWETDAYGLTMAFKLVDIIGLVRDRIFEPPTVLPTKLKDWIALIVSHLGINFEDRFIVDASISEFPLIATLDGVKSLKCGELLRYLCMAAGAFFRADSATGYLRVEPLQNAIGSRISMDNMISYPKQSANSDIANITFRLAGGIDYTVAGTLGTAGNSLSVTNPFITTQAEANLAARNIIASYGGNRFTVQGRGDMSAELGDINIIEVGFDQESSARRIRQQLRIFDHVMTNVPSSYIQATGSSIFTHRVELTEGGTWTAPVGVTSLQIIVVGPGDLGADGTSGTWTESGVPGVGGAGGKVFIATITINSGQSFNVQINNTATVFGAYNSNNGILFSNGFGDIFSGGVYGSPGADGNANSRTVDVGQPGNPGTGNGGQGGSGGAQGVRAWQDGSGWVIKRNPVNGGTGGFGGSGCVIIYWSEV